MALSHIDNTKVRYGDVSDAGNPKANFDGQPQLKAALEQMVTNVANQVKLRNMQATRPELNIV